MTRPTTRRGFLRTLGIGAAAVLLPFKLGAAKTPAVGPSSGVVRDVKGYPVGSVWIDTSTGVRYICIGSTESRETWRPAAEWWLA